jgi:hypothetical protein
MRFRLWINDKESTSFVFIDKLVYKKHQKTIEKIAAGKDITPNEESSLSEDIPSRLWKNQKAVFLDKIIHRDDTIGMLLKRLCVYLKPWLSDSTPDEIYTWVHRKVDKGPGIVANFVSNCFESHNKLPFTEFARSVTNYFDGLVIENTGFNIIDKVMAFEMLIKSDIKSIIEPLQFRYTYNDYFSFLQYNPLKGIPESTSGLGKSSYNTITLQHFGDLETIEMIVRRDYDHDIYFPFYNKSTKIGDVIEFVDDMDMIEEKIDEGYRLAESEGISHSGNISFFQFKYNETNFNKKSDLGKAFDRLVTSDVLPFMKYRTYTNVFYKVSKDFMKNLDNNAKHWERWTELTGLGRKCPENTSIIFKLAFLKDSYCSFRLYDNFVYDIKFSIGKSRKTLLEKIRLFCKTEINSLLKEIRSVYPDQFIPDIDPEQVSIVQSTSVNTLSMSKKTIKSEKFKDTVEKLMFPYFNIINTKERNMLHLQYKKVDNYMKYDNITAFILERIKDPVDEVIDEMSRWFKMMKEDAKKEYEKRQEEIKMELANEGGKKVFRPKTDGFVNIIIKLLSPVDMEFEVSGFKYMYTYTRIVELMKTLVVLTNYNIDLEGIDLKMLERGLAAESKKDGIALGDIDKADIEGYDRDPDFIEGDEKAAFAEEIGEAFFADIAPELLAIAEEFKDVPDVEEVAPPSKSEGVRQEGYTLGMLKIADKELFEYKKVRRNDFPTKCSGRYPIVINKQQKDHIDNISPNSYKNFVKVGSTEELAEKNYYICPQVWCPKSMVSMTKEQYDEKKCPFSDEGEMPVFSKDPEQMYVGVLDPYLREDKICVPCCFTKDPNKSQTMRNKIDTCKKAMPRHIYIDKNGEEVEEDVIDIFEEDEANMGNKKYIKGELNWPLLSSHFGVLPKELLQVLGGKKCGERHDGSGNMVLGSEGYLRRGCSNREQSFLACIVELIDNPDITSVADLVKAIKEKLTVERFVSLENGKIMKVFVNDSFNIFDPEKFKEFVTWFINQKRYAVRMNLGKVYRVLEQRPTVFSRNLRHYKDVTREFIVYNAYKHFLAYLDNPDSKDHRVLIDLVNNEKEFINVKNLNIVLMEVGNGVRIQCPFNRSVSYNRTYPFSFVLWNGRYYEILSLVSFTEKYGVYPKTGFVYRHTNPEMKALIDFVYNNCLDTSTTPEATIAGIEMATGLKAKAMVIDYSFKAKGIQLVNNLYVPFEKKISIYGLLRKKFVYYSDLVNYKCTVENPKKVYATLAKKSPFYKVKEVNESYMVLESGIVVPLAMKRVDVKYDIFENDLEIFIGEEREDPRKILIGVINENKKVFSTFLNSVITYINSNKEVRQEIDFLTDFKNPFPMNFKRKRLSEIMSSIMSRVIVPSKDKEALEPCPDPAWDKCLVGVPDDKLKEFKTKVSEQLLISNSFYFDNRTKMFGHSQQEFLFEHHDLLVGKHRDWVKRLQDPFKVLVERLDEEFGEYVFSSVAEGKSYVKEFVAKWETKNNYDKFKKYFKTLVLDAGSSYNNMFLYQWFEALYKTLRGADIDANRLKGLVRNHVLSDYEGDAIGGVLQNKSFDYLLKQYKKREKEDPGKPTLKLCEELWSGVQYFPGMYEIGVLSEFVGVNVIVFTRSGKDNESGLEYIYNRSSHYIMIHVSFDRQNNRDVFMPVVADEELRQAVFNRKELKSLVSLLDAKDKIVEIDVDDDLIDTEST